jgi:general secretion pathway protein I
MKRLRGFTLLEVMIGLALLGLALTVLIKSAAGSIFNAEQAHMMGIVTDLGRAQMYEIEEQLMKDGFTDTDQSQLDAKTFADQGWPNVKYSYKVEAVEMPSFDELQSMAQGHAAKGSGAGSGSATGSNSQFGSAWGSGAGSNGDPLNSFQNSALGGMLNMMGAFGGKKDVLGAQGGALIQTQYTMFQQILKVSVRKVTLTLTYQVLGSDRDLKLVAFFTDAQAMDKVLSGLGAIDLGDDSGTGSGAGSGSGTRPTRTGTGSNGSGATK